MEMYGRRKRQVQTTFRPSKWIGGLLIYFYYCNSGWGGESATTTHHGNSKAKEEGSVFTANQINNTEIPLGDVVGF